MTEKAKRTGLIIAGILLCAALVIGIAGRFTSALAAEDPTISDNGPDTKIPRQHRHARCKCRNQDRYLYG